MDAKIESFKALEANYRLTIQELLRFHAFCERAAAQMFGYGLQFLEDTKALKFVSWHITEEVTHYTMVANLYKAHTGTSLEPWVFNRLKVHPLPTIHSYLDLGLAQWLFDLAGNKQIEGYEHCSWEPYRTILAQILKDERGHQAHGRDIALSLCKVTEDKAKAQETFKVWLRQALICFGPPDSARDAYAVSVGIKQKPAAQVIQGFLEEIREDVDKAGLKIPSEDELGMNLGKAFKWPA